MIDKTDSMETIWSQLTNQIIQHVYSIKPYFWVFTMRAKSNGLLILNLQNEHPVFSIQNKNDAPLFSNFSELGLTDKLKGFQIDKVKIAEDQSVIMSLTSENQTVSLKFQLAPYAPRFQLIQFDEILYDSILGWQPKDKIKSKPAILSVDHSLDIEWIIRYSYSMDYLQIIKKTLIRKVKLQKALKNDLKTH